MRILITAGPTREAIDPIRYLTNRSSGKMAYAIAEAALSGGHEVILVSGPVSLPTPPGAEINRIESAREMFESVRDRIDDCDAAIFCAAVADYRPRKVSESKIKKTAESLTLELERTEDILGSVRPKFGFEGILVGFAAETDDLEQNARAKLKSKGCDLIAANEIGREGIGFDAEENEVRLFFADGRTEFMPQQSKAEIGEKLVEFVEELVKGGARPARA